MAKKRRLTVHYLSEVLMDRGVVIGCDRKMEALLPWWFRRYRIWNDYPVLCVDFGMSERGIAWCRSNLLYERLGDSRLPLMQVEEETRKRWEERAGSGVWAVREAWMKKPLAFLASPFEISCWIDLDCEVNCDLDPLFNSLLFGAEIAAARDPDVCQWLDRRDLDLKEGEVTYNSGVVVFRKGIELLSEWAERALSENHRFLGDQNVLSRLIFEKKPFLVELDPIYNWKRDLGENRNAKIIHYSGDRKEEIVRSKEFIEQNGQ